MNEWTSTQAIVDSVCGIYIKHTIRGRQYIEGRAIYYKIMRDFYGKSLASIGLYLNKTHATVINGIKNLDNWIEQDEDLKKRYNEVLSQVRNGVEDAVMFMSHDELSEENRALKKDLECLTLALQNAEREINRMSKKEGRFDVLFKRIEQQVPQGKEHLAVMKINQFLNGLSI
jgi:hypothetical protein